MTASTPPLVDVIAEAIAEHDPELDQTACPTGYCICNEKFATDEAHATHQASAVLDALEQAEQAAHYAATVATMTPEQVSATMERVKARRRALDG